MGWLEMSSRLTVPLLEADFAPSMRLSGGMAPPKRRRRLAGAFKPPRGHAARNTCSRPCLTSVAVSVRKNAYIHAP